ncbi:carboxypeptidase-like regulatory domain-containing protein [Clostridium bornimense]|uniref:carboxypeptidase-like regulatory domain-containing protein n=1 Tax=Clostridium bornimense TaxID=1216932 RepID=UPI001C11C149|nr:carboxypeptidase-like regulatory domain-containing protein [Clostridium bornimense]
MKGKKIAITIMIITSLCTVNIGYSYFNARVKMKNRNNNPINKMYITNGNSKVEINTADSKWQYGDSKDVEGSVVNPEDGLEVSYKGVKVTNKSNLTSNLSLSLNFTGEKVGGTREGDPNIGDDNVDVDHREDMMGFDLLVGDIDNLGFGYEGIDPFTQITPVHNLDVYPEDSGDVQGTDRKMVNTGFYNFFNRTSSGGFGNTWSSLLYTTKSGITFGEDGNWNTEAYKWPLKWNTINPQSGEGCSFGGYFYKKKDGTWTHESKFYDKRWNIDTNKVGELEEDNGEIFFDGYTNTTLGHQKTHIFDGVDWGTMQKVEPLKFIYKDKIREEDKDKKVSSATIQVMFDDVQPQPSEDFKEYKADDAEWRISSFSAKSTNKYQVTLAVEGNDKYPEVRVPEFEEIINNIDQHGPRGNLVTFEVPKRFLKYIENGGDGLLLKVDDPRDGTIYTGMKKEDGTVVGKNYDGTDIKLGDVASGDSYSIDFAKITVNGTIDRSAGIEGRILDNEGNPIKGAVITGSGIEGNVITDENGYYYIDKVAPGQVILKITHPLYTTRVSTIYHVNSGDIVTLNVNMLPTGEEPIISAKIKFTGSILINKYKQGTNIPVGEPIVKEIKIIKSGEKYSIDDISLKVEPGFYYNIDYNLKLYSKGSIDTISEKGFKLKFNSEIKAKITQENNNIS